MRPAGPYTADDIGTPINRSAWRMTKDGKTYTWDEYERSIGTPSEIRTGQALALASMAMADSLVEEFRATKARRRKRQ